MHRASGTNAGRDAPSGSAIGLSTDAFASEFEVAARSLWCIAAAVVGDRTLADDIVQEAALIGLRKRGDFRPGTSFGAWMGQVVRNVARNSLRQRIRHHGRTSDGAPLEAIAAGAAVVPDAVSPRGEVMGDQASFDDDVVHALGELTEAARTCLLLRTVMDMSYREMADLLGIPRGTAMSHVHRARQEMRRILTKTGPRTGPSNEDGRGTS